MSDPPQAVRHYAVRRVNPFEGVLQVVETHNARAYSPDGRVWQVQVLTERPDHTWRSFSHIEPVAQFFNFGLWDAAEGLHRIPANPLLDVGGMSRAAEALTAHLADLSSHLPFRLEDRFECWATDHEGRPVALLATSEDQQRIDDLHVGRWHATRLAEHGFVARSLLARDIPAAGDLGPRQHAEHLERQVRQLAQHKAWFERLAGGGGQRLKPGSSAAPLPADAFPAAGLRTEWGEPQASELALDYLAWQAPRLLMLQTLDDELRAWLEVQACKQAVELAAGYRLIPQMIDPQRIESARVEARLRTAAR